MSKRQRIVVVGHGMTGHRFAQAAVERGLTETHDVLVVGEEPRAAYDRVALTSWFGHDADGGGDEALTLLPGGEYDDPRVRLVLDTVVTEIDRAARTVTVVSPPAAVGDPLAHPGAVTVHEYDVLVLATGAAPFVPPVPGRGLAGCFVYRTIEDLQAIKAASATATSGIVIGGGLLGLEAANALVQLGLDTHVVEMAPRLMPVQLDGAAGSTLVRHIERLGVTAHTGVLTEEVEGRDSVTGLRMRPAGTEEGAPTTTVEAQVVVFSAGIRPRDALARECDLAVAERGGVLVDEQCRSSDPAIFAIGECAAPGGTMYGLVAPGYAMAEVVVDALLDGPGTFTGADMSTKLKLLGVDVASFGDAFATTPGSLELVYSDAVAGVYKKLVVAESEAGSFRLLGGILVGDASAYGVLRPMVSSGLALPDNPEQLILPVGGGVQLGMPDEAQVCSCNDVTKADILHAVTEQGCEDVAAVKQCTRAGSTCGSCVPTVKNLIEEHFASVGKVVDKGLCEHFRLTRQELFDVVAVHGYRRFDDIVEAHGTGRGCDVCKPAIASILASQTSTHVLEPRDGRAAGHQRRLPRQHPAQRHLLRRPAHPRRRDHPGEADRHRGGRPRLRPLHQDHRRPADRPLRRPDGAAARDLATARRRRLRVRARLRQVAADGEVLRGLDLVPLRRPGLRRPRDRAGAALPRPAQPPQAQGRRQRVRPRVRRGARQGLRRDRHREGVEPLRRRQRRREARPRPAPGG